MNLANTTKPTLVFSFPLPEKNRFPEFYDFCSFCTTGSMHWPPLAGQHCPPMVLLVLSVYRANSPCSVLPDTQNSFCYSAGFQLTPRGGTGVSQRYPEDASNLDIRCRKGEVQEKGLLGEKAGTANMHTAKTLRVGNCFD